MGTLGRRFFVPLRNSVPPTDPLSRADIRSYTGKLATPHQGTGICQEEAAGLGRPELKPALMHFC